MTLSSKPHIDLAGIQLNQAKIFEDKFKNNSLIGGNNNNNREDMLEAAQKFEAIFIQKMFDEMMKTTDMTKSFGKGSGGDFFKDMFLINISEDVTKRNPIGLADEIMRQFRGRFDDKDDTNDIANENKIRNLAESDYSRKMSNIKLESKKVGMLEGLEGLKPSNLQTFKPSNQIPKIQFDKVEKYDHIIQFNAEKFGIDSALVKAVIKNESNGDYKAESKKGAKGLMQLMDSTAEELGVTNSFDPYQNIKGGVSYLKKMMDMFDNDFEKAVAAYNAGPGNVRKYDGIPPFKETQEYVERVKKSFDKYKKIEL